MEVKTYKVALSQGRYLDHLPFLTDKEMEEFNIVGYSGTTLGGIRMTQEDYLNNLGIGHFTMTQTRWDTGDYITEYIIHHVLPTDCIHPVKEYRIEAEVTTPQYLTVRARTEDEAMSLAHVDEGWETGDEGPREIISVKTD